ncbi:GtrA family protein, partial [Salmonella sp. 6309]|uniref:GtrA family protein n=1 Tax=Salmonella sp. 6309 TaxID=3159579 RepID=UPI00397B9999
RARYRLARPLARQATALMIAIRLPTARYLATGGVCTGVHYSLMYVLIRQGVGTTVSSGIGAGMALMLSYVLNNRWVFPNQI